MTKQLVCERKRNENEKGWVTIYEENKGMLTTGGIGGGGIKWSS